MPKNKLDKKIPALVASFENILVCNNKNLRPFVEVFVFESENITQKNLGTLLGIFEITDASEDSSYIVNYLSSIIKKEYFSRPKRAPIESFEAALHRANLALSKLAEHGNVKWIGKFNALIAIIEKNNLHITQSGTASAFLLRSRGMTDISEGLSSHEAEPHPLKTFVNVSSGRMESQDKLIITTDGIFEIFSLEEIKKSALRFPGEKFIQFLRTALGNELEKAAVLVVDIMEKEEAEPAKVPRNGKYANAFSQAAFSRETAHSNASSTMEAGGRNAAPTREKISAEMNKEIASEIQMGQPEFTDEKNGHIYIKETTGDGPNSNHYADYMVAFSEKIGIAQNSFKKISKHSWQSLLGAAKKISLPKISPSAKKIPDKKIIEKAAGRGSLMDFFEKAGGKIKNVAAALAPDFSKIKKITSEMDYQQKLYAALVVLAIIFVPLFGLKLSKYIQDKQIKPAEPVVEVAIPLEQDKNVIRVADLVSDKFEGDPIYTAINLNNKMFAVSQSSITSLADQSLSSIPDNFGDLKLAAGMDDLNLIFLINKNGETISYSPSSKKFQNNSISLPENSNITAVGTYLTYFYLVDSQNNQIYRYPRASGGFGTAAKWLKDPLDLSKASGIALSDSIFIADNNALIKLFKGKKQDFQIENTATPIAPYKVFTKPEFSYVYILDKQNSRVVKIDPNGSIISQYYNAEIGSASDFAIDEINNTAYISNPSEIKSFSIN
ncbi:MAG: hypothetical protein WCX17_03240 [Parcubacteria group bacterium]|jgi:hypothetical protein